MFKQFCSVCYSSHKLECSLTLDGNKRSDARSQLAAMVVNRMFESEDDEAATLEDILDPFVRNKTLSASAAEAFCKKGTGGVVWKTPGEENTFLATFIFPP